jgi:hypothetical protein
MAAVRWRPRELGLRGGGRVGELVARDVGRGQLPLVQRDRLLLRVPQLVYLCTELATLRVELGAGLRKCCLEFGMRGISGRQRRGCGCRIVAYLRRSGLVTPSLGSERVRQARLRPLSKAWQTQM